MERKEFVGKNNPSYIDGRTNEEHKCQICGKEISVYSIKCVQCENKNSHASKGGITNKEYHCKICGTKISLKSGIYGNGLCHKCANKLIAKKRKGTKNPEASKRMKNNWKSKNWLKNIVPKLKHVWTEESKQKLLKQLNKREITGIEKQTLSIIDKFGLPYRYCGSGNHILDIHGFSPDFVCKDKKLLIEVFYEYFKNKQYGSTKRYMKQRYAIFRSYGYKTLFIPYSLLKYSTEEEIANRILNFTKGE
jgi:hypothetical protein